MMDPPRKWAYLVAVGPVSILLGLTAMAVAALETPGAGALFLLVMVLNGLSLPAVMIGIWRDTKMVERATGVTQRAWLWNTGALFLAPLVGSVYLLKRRSHFATKPG
jgi:hypothetical protein